MIPVHRVPIISGIPQPWKSTNSRPHSRLSSSYRKVPQIPKTCHNHRSLAATPSVGFNGQSIEVRQRHTMKKNNLANGHGPVTQREIFFFWLPLAAMWLVMGIEQPLTSAFIARLADAKNNLASYGLSYSLTIIIESPVMLMLTAGTALAADRVSYRKLLNLMHLSAVGLTILHLAIGLSPLYSFIVGTLIGAPPDIVQPSRVAFLIMSPSAAAVGYRRLWQGVLIRHGQTVSVPVTMVMRLAVIALLLSGGLITRAMTGVTLAAVAATSGLLVGAVASYFYFRTLVKKELSDEAKHGRSLTWRSLLAFSVPLWLTSIILVAARPILTTGMARLPLPLESLAVWPVIQGFLFIFRSIGVSLQEVSVALLRDKKKLAPLKRFVFTTSGILLLAYLVVALTPACRLWFQGVAGISADLYSFVLVPVWIMAVVPSMSAIIAFYRGFQVTLNRTPVVTKAVIVNVFFLGLCVFAGVLTQSVSGAIAAALALSLSKVAEAFYLWLESRAKA